MVKHRSGTWWPDDREVGWRCVRSVPCARRWGVWVSWFSLKTKVDGFSRFSLKTGGYGLCGLASKPLTRVSRFGLKTGRWGLVIWPTKSPWRFLSLGLKTKWAMICRLRHKTDRRIKTVRDTHRNLVACFTWKRVGLGFPSPASRLAEAQCGWCTWHYHGGRVEMKPKMEGSMRRDALNSSTPTLPFWLYFMS
jgi:hypothetical protein